jgi:cbb3-type cytochrome oxidase subunit 1
MSPLTVRCIKAAFCYLALGIFLGASFAIERSIGVRLRFLHAEFNLWGWSTLLIYGMGYHMLPRFLGRPLRWPKLAELQSWAAIVGVALMSLGWLSQSAGSPLAFALLLSGGLLQLFAASAFVAQIASMLLKQANQATSNNAA